MSIIKDLKKAQKKIKDISSRFDLSCREKELKIVNNIIHEVKVNGDKALISYAKKFENITLKTLAINKTEISSSVKLISKELLDSIQFAVKRITMFQKTNSPKSWLQAFSFGEKLGYRYEAVDSVGIYIPGGKIPLISTVLMTVIPAKVAGVKRIAVFTPPPVHKGILAACNLLGVDEIYQVGGAQAIAAAAFGTKTIKPVDKVVGPGNIYVTLAKKQLFGKIGIDGLYGPSEIAIIADSSANPTYIAMDLLSQLEHGSGLESAVLITNSKLLAKTVEEKVKEFAKELPNKETVLKSWKKNSAIILVQNLTIAVDLINQLAPEHLEIIAKDQERISAKIKNAGAIFLGKWTCESIGDYVAGPSHCLPTGGSAKFSSGLTVMDFMKKISIVSFNEKAFKSVSKHVVRLATSEKLKAHGDAVKIRFNQAGE